jgi:hypothetical protein
VITVHAPNTSAGLRDLIEDLFTYYRPGVAVPDPADFMSEDEGAASDS